MYSFLLALLVALASFSVNEGKVSDVCAEVLADNLASRLSACLDDTCRDNVTTVLNLRSWFDVVLQSNVCTQAVPANNTGKSIQWLQYPGWHNGLVFSWLRADAEVSPVLLAFNATPPEWLPAPSVLADADEMHELTDRSTGGYAVVSSDYSTTSLVNFLAVQSGSRSSTSSGRGFNHLPENACADYARPTGPLHPRTYLLLHYRPDALAMLRAMGLAPSSDPPPDWDSMIALLQAHAAGVTVAAGPAGGGNGTGPAVSAGSGGSSATAGQLPRYGMCVTTSPNCGRLGDVLNAIAATVVQTMGGHKGYAFDIAAPPPAAIPLVNNPGWRYAIGLLQRLLVYNAPDGGTGAADSTQSCSGVSQHFLSGDCLMTLEWDAALPLMAAAPALQRPGALGVAPLPGSTYVMSRSGGAAGELVKCTPHQCGLSINHDVLYLRAAHGGTLSAATLAAADAAAAAVASVQDPSDGGVHVLDSFAAREAAAAAQLGPAAAPGSSWINRAPYSAAYDAVFYVSYLGFDRGMIPNIALMQETMTDKIASFRTLRQNFTDSLRTTLGYFVRTAGDEQNCSGYAAALWWQALAPGGQPPDVWPLAAATGLRDATAAAEYLTALWHAVHSPNLAVDVQSPVLINWFRYAASHAALLLLRSSATIATNANASAALTSSSQNNLNSSSVTPASGGSTAAGGPSGPMDQSGEDPAVAAAVALLTRLYGDAVMAFGNATVREAYTAAISAHMWQAEENGDQSGLSSGQVAAIVASLAAGLLLAAGAALLLLLLRHRRKRHRDLLGRVMAPRVGSDTTLLVTDVQNSTVLWEQLPVDVMDVAVKLHHGAIRGLLAKYDGYESATEGDSFIVAFPEPAKAVAFAAAAQVELMVQQWPSTLLRHPDAAPVVVLADPRVVMSGALGFGAVSTRAVAQASSKQLTGVITPRCRSSLSGYTTSGFAPGPPATSGSNIAFIAGGGAVGPAADATTGPGAKTDNSINTFGDIITTNTINATHAESPPQAAADGPSSFSPLPVTCYATAFAEAAKVCPTAVHLAIADAVVGRGREVHSTGRESLEEDRGVAVAAFMMAATGSGQSGCASGGGLNRTPPATREVTADGYEAEIGQGSWCTWVKMVSAAFPVWLPPDEEALLAAAGEEWVVKRNGLSTRLPDGGLATVAFRGLRVRMGLHTGLTDPQHVVFNKVGSAFKYYGPFAELAKLVSDCAPGGMVTLSGACFARLRNSAPPRDRGVGGKVGSSTGESVVLYAGHHILSDQPAPRPRTCKSFDGKVAIRMDDPDGERASNGAGGGNRRTAKLAGGLPAVLAARPRSNRGAAAFGFQRSRLSSPNGADGPGASQVAGPGAGAGSYTSTHSLPHPHSVFLALPAALLSRLALSPPLRTVQQVQNGTPAAPVGRVCVAFMKVVGASTLLAEIPGPASRALEQFQSLVCRLLGGCGGYLVEGGDGLVLAAFGSAPAAVEWALDCVAGLQRVAWDEELLEHELCAEELVTRANLGDDNVQGLAPGRSKTLMHGGLRVKVGLDVGHATHTLTEASGRLSYRGKVMNRAARVSGVAGAGQVLCTGAVWEGCVLVEGFCERVVGYCLGRMSLKGISHPVEVVQCAREVR